MKKKLIMFLLTIGLLSALFFVVACGSSGGDYYEDSSNTNVQVEGIDEPDIVKVTDDGYIYKVQSDGITVSKASNGYVEVISQTSVPTFTPQEIFINDNFLVVIGYQKLYDNSYDTIIYLYDTNELTYISGGEITTNVKPKRVTTIFKAEYFTARIYNDVFYLAVSDRLIQDEVKFSDTLEGDKSSERIIVSKTSSTRKLFTIVRLELKSFIEKYLIYTYQGDIKEIYCSPYAIYALSYARNYSGCSSGQGTQITKISYQTLKVEAENSVPGTVKDRFSLFDNGENFFAVNYNRSPMLSSFNKKLESISSLEFAYGEQLYSVSYEEKFCYAVTFKQVDPLFKIDISDPTNLKIIGELKIPGFSNYLQAFGKDRMIGIGYAGDLRTAEGTQLKVSLFDTSKDEPVEINSLTFNSNTSSLAYSNPRAILCEVENNIFAFEVTEKDLNYNPRRIIKQSIFVLGVNEDALFVRANLSSLTYNSKSDKTRSYFTRLTRINAYLYAISDGYIVSYNINDFSLISVIDTRIKKDMFTVSFITNLDYVITNSVEEGKKVSEPKNLENPGYTLEGWYLDDEFTVIYNFNDLISKNIKLYAKWVEI